MGKSKRKLEKSKMGKGVLTEEAIDIPEGVTVDIKNKMVSVKGPLGTIRKGFGNLPCLLRKRVAKNQKNQFVVSVWFKNRKQRASVKTLTSLVDNMMVGVTKGYRYVMKYGFKRHPMKPASSKDGKSIKISNYLGAEEVKSITAPKGVTIECDPENPQKEIILTGIDNESVGTCASMIHQSCRPRALDRRKFEDGLYIQKRGLIDEE